MPVPLLRVYHVRYVAEVSAGEQFVIAMRSKPLSVFGGALRWTYHSERFGRSVVDADRGHLGPALSPSPENGTRSRMCVISDGTPASHTTGGSWPGGLQM